MTIDIHILEVMMMVITLIVSFLNVVSMGFTNHHPVLSSEKIIIRNSNIVGNWIITILTSDGLIYLL